MISQNDIMSRDEFVVERHWPYQALDEVSAAIPRDAVARNVLISRAPSASAEFDGLGLIVRCLISSL